jgi:hypothetical protein
VGFLARASVGDELLGFRGLEIWSRVTTSTSSIPVRWAHFVARLKKTSECLHIRHVLTSCLELLPTSKTEM